MVMTLAPTETLTYVRAIRLIVGGYGAYSRERRRETDVAVKEEILRAAKRARNHLANIHDAAIRCGEVALARTCAAGIESADALANDVSVGELGGEHPFLSQQISVSRGTIGRLIEHDHETLTMLTRAVRASNRLEADWRKDADAARASALACTQLLASVRGHFSERRRVLRNIGRR